MTTKDITTVTTKYICDFCAKDFSTPGKAMLCESEHKRIEQYRLGDAISFSYSIPVYYGRENEGRQYMHENGTVCKVDVIKKQVLVELEDGSRKFASVSEII